MKNKIRAVFVTAHFDWAEYKVFGTTSSWKEFSEILLVGIETPGFRWKNEEFDQEDLRPGEGSDWREVINAVKEEEAR